MKTADLGGHCLFLHKASFCRWRHIYYLLDSQVAINEKCLDWKKKGREDLLL